MTTKRDWTVDAEVKSLPAIPAGSNNIGDVDVLSLPALAPGSNNIGDVDIATMPPVVQGAAGAAGWPVKTLAGDEVAVKRFVGDPLDDAGAAVAHKFARINATADGDNLIVAGVGGKKLRVLGMSFALTAAGTITIQDTTGTPVIFGQYPLAANGGLSYHGGIDAPMFETAVGAGIEINNPAGIDTLGMLDYVEL
jgi:hypothetical protein